MTRAAGYVRRRLNAFRARRLEARLAGPKLLRGFAARFPSAVFIEIGANDGAQHDHLRPLILDHRWRGVLVEPVPYVFERLRANYAEADGVSLENAAISDRDGQRPFFHLASSPDHESEGLPSWYDAIGSFSRQSVLDHARLIPDVASRLVETQTRCLTFDSLCAKHGIERVDLLLIDTEGHDYEILRHVDLHNRRPVLVIYEHYHLSQQHRVECRRLMNSAGYETMPEGFDTWCLRLDADAALTRTWRRLRPALPELTVQAEPR